MFGEKLDTSYNTCNNHEDICYTDEGFLLVASSSLTYRYWKGKICLYTEQASSQGCTINNQLKQPPPHTVFSENTITNMKYLSSSNIVLTSHDSGEVALWKLPEENDEFNGIASNVGHDDSILSLDINADQSKFVSGSSDCQIKIWSVSECNIQAAYTGHSELVSSTAFHPSSLDVLASCSQDRKMLFWDLRKLKPVFNSYTFNDLVPTLVTYFKSDPNLLLIASEAGEVVQMDTRKLSHCLSKTQLHKSTINRISLSQSNPNFLATCSDDLSVVVSKLHKDSSLNIEYKDTSHKDFVKGIVWSPKRSSLIASCSWDGNIFLHNTILSSNIPSKNFGYVMPVEIYHERQHLALCALHSLNNLFQKSIFTKSQLDEISESLTPKKWFNPHRSYIGLGNYDINVITFALERQGYDFQWFDKRKDIGAEDLQSFFGFVINCHNYFHLGSFSVPSFQNHWYCVRSVNSSYYNLDSKLSSPKLIGDQDQLVSFLKNKIDDKGTSIFLIKKIT